MIDNRQTIYIQYYLKQQQDRGMPVFSGSSWQRGYGQTGYGLGGLFRRFGKLAKPMIKSGAKALGKIALISGVNLLGDVLSGKNPKQAAKAHALEGASIAKMQAIQQAQTYTQIEDDLNPPSVRASAELKRERHLSLSQNVNRPSEREHLVKTYLVNYEFRPR